MIRIPTAPLVPALFGGIDTVGAQTLDRSPAGSLPAFSRRTGSGGDRAFEGHSGERSA